MTKEVLISQVIAVLVVVILGGLCWILFGRRPHLLDKEAAAKRLNFDEPDFEPSRWLTSETNGAALAANTNNEIAVIRTAGANYVTRRLIPGSDTVQRNGKSLRLSMSDHTFRKLTIDAPNEAEARAWEQQISNADPMKRVEL